jgi:rSAM/selenodomain-associated transferase 2
MKLSVVIPVLNERDSLPATIAALRACRGITESVVSETGVSKTTATKTAASTIMLSEIIIADGGSTDGTADWVRAQQDLILVDSARGKGPQLNAGAARATGDMLLFLHADCILSPPAFRALQSAWADNVVCGGAFYVRFAERRPRSLHIVAWGINVRARLRNSATGDQGIFVRRDVFQSVGGAPDWPLFEDVELVRRIKRAGKFLVLKTPLTISPRRYLAHGVWHTVFLVYFLRFAYWLGVPPQRLKNWFRDARGKQV